jgi:probable F420-dependent oxidoreductase
MPDVDDGGVRFGVMFLTLVDVDLGALGRAVEELGFESLFASEHTHCATSFIDEHPEEADYYGAGARMFDPFVALASIAPVTRTLRLGTGICLVPQHHPIVLAKQVATLDRISDGRVLFGIGAGWVPAETAHHGVAFERRFDVMRDHVLAMRALWTGDEVSYAGEFVGFDRVRSLEPVQRPSPPILVGGAGRRARAAVGEYGDGWFPIHPFDPAAEVSAHETTVCFFAGTNEEDVVARYAAAGVHRCVVVCDPHDHAALEQLAAQAARYA